MLINKKKSMKNNRYKDIQVPVEQIVEAIKNKQDIPIQLNFLQEAWIDTWLVDTYGIDPLLQNEYPKTTGELRQAYNL